MAGETGAGAGAVAVAAGVGETSAIRSVLVANRGEIARRIFRGCRELGIVTVAVFAEDDRFSPYVREANHAVALGGGPVAGTYLDPARIVEAAVCAGADAVHPGYGFLSEDPTLAEACAAAGLVWVGPPVHAMRIMAHKSNAIATVAAAGVPVLVGRVVAEEAAGAPDVLCGLGEEVGYPLLVKASAGGGGRGMRLVGSAGELVEAVTSARREALASFGSTEVFLERYVVAPRHVEVQVVADRHGAVCHLFDRECSIQRRHQKVIEEAPAALIPLGVRERMWHAAIEAARTVSYEGVGTVEFVVGDALDGGGDCAFLEMNTRLQVEHGITELVTGLDLVHLQLSVAAGFPLPFTQADVAVHGHAIEARLCAERPADGYRPSPGTAVHVRWPTGPGLRVDAAIESGSVVSATYDSLVAKIMAVADRRETALAILGASLGGGLELDGIGTNRDLLASVLGSADFVAGRVSTDFLEEHPEIVDAGLSRALRRRHVAAAALWLDDLRAHNSVVPGAIGGWRNVGHAGHVDRFATGAGNEPVASASVARSCGLLRVMVDDESFTGHVDLASGVVSVELDGLFTPCDVRVHGALVSVGSPEGQSTLTLIAEDDSGHAATLAGECRAPLPGSVVGLLVAPGDAVEVGSALVVMEAMKMEHTLRAAAPGIVRSVDVGIGDQVDAGALLVEMEPAE